MTPQFEHVQKLLRRLPGLGHRSAERLALHLFVEKPESLGPLLEALATAGERLRACRQCGNIAEEDLCSICSNPKRDERSLCVVESVPDIVALERSAAFQGLYHVLQGKLSPIQGVGVEQLTLGALKERLDRDPIEEIILALSNDIEGEATCHYIQDEILAGRSLKVSRIGFGLPSGGGLVFADATTVKSALDGRRYLSSSDGA